MNTLFPRIARGTNILKSARLFTTSANVEKYCAQHSLNSDFFMASKHKVLLVNTQQTQPQRMAARAEEVLDSYTDVCLNNFFAANVVDSVDGDVQSNLLECTSVLRKRRGKMNRHKLKKRRRRERFSTRRTTTS